jgi:hypothetical protein
MSHWTGVGICVVIFLVLSFFIDTICDFIHKVEKYWDEKNDL